MVFWFLIQICWICAACLVETNLNLLFSNVREIWVLFFGLVGGRGWWGMSLVHPDSGFCGVEFRVLGFICDLYCTEVPF